MNQPDWKVVKEYEDITYKKSGGVARIAFNRPEVRNAFDDPAYRDRREELRADLDAWWARQSTAYPDEIKSYTKT